MWCLSKAYLLAREPFGFRPEYHDQLVSDDRENNINYTEDMNDELTQTVQLAGSNTTTQVLTIWSISLQDLQILAT